MLPTTETHLLIPSPAGHLETWVAPSPEGAPKRQAIAIICHPHPLYGGTMNNKVVSALARAYSHLGVTSIRFQFRGVGKSTGTYAEGLGELQDLYAVMDWINNNTHHQALWLSGFSFGAAITALAACERPIQQLISIAPPVPRFQLPALKRIECPWLVVQGEQDDNVVPQDVYDWVAARDPQPELVRVSEAGHFFHGQLLVLREIVERYINNTHPV